MPISIAVAGIIGVTFLAIMTIMIVAMFIADEADELFLEMLTMYGETHSDNAEDVAELNEVADAHDRKVKIVDFLVPEWLMPVFDRLYRSWWS